MTPKRLLDHFDRISDAPDAIPRMQQFILDLAVRGKLIEQDPNDEPAFELLKRIQAEKARLVKEGKIRKQKPLPSMVPDEIPLELPGRWAWLRLGQIGFTQTGTTPSSNEPKYFGDYIPFVKPADLTGNAIDYSGGGISKEGVKHSRLIAKHSALMVCIGSSIGKVNVTDRDVCCNQQINAVTPYIGDVTAFLSFALRAAYFQKLVFANAGMGTLPIISKSKWEILPIPLPPLAEQHRIVAKVDELMALCDRLEATQKERESRRDLLAAASLHRLNNGANTDEFREHARFHLRHLPRLTTRPEHIQKLRQTILNLTVRGKLVPQDPNDEPATELLTQIQRKKNRLVQEGKIGKEKLLPKIRESDLPFALPDTWTWVRLGMICQLVTSGSRDWAKFYSVKGAIFLRMGNLSRGSYRLRLDNVQRVTAPADSEGARTKLQEGDILISITGDVGMLGLIPLNFGDAYINQHTCVVRLMDQLKNRYLPELFRSPFAQSQFNEPQRGIKNSFRLTDVTQFLVPLPPLTEQHRIIAKVDELMALCDRLDAQLTSTQTESRRLLEAFLHEALNGSVRG